MSIKRRSPTFLTVKVQAYVICPPWEYPGEWEKSKRGRYCAFSNRPKLSLWGPTFRSPRIRYLHHGDMTLRRVQSVRRAQGCAGAAWAALLVLGIALRLVVTQSSRDSNNPTVEASAPSVRAAVKLSPQLQQEIESFEALSREDPHNASLHYTTGMLYQLAGQPQEVTNNA